MGLQAVLNRQTDFTGEFPVEYAKDGLWRFNENAPGCGHRAYRFLRKRQEDVCFRLVGYERRLPGRAEGAAFPHEHHEPHFGENLSESDE